MMDNGQMGVWMGTWGLTAWLFHAVFWIVLIAVPVLLVLWVSGRRDSPAKQESALDILKKRYATGEIDRETFERMKKDIE